MSNRSHWSGRFAFILAAAGSAIGLGNMWKFPYITGLNGGGAFVIVYLITILAIGFPILLAELYVGQKGQANAVDSIDIVAGEKTPFRIVGFMGMLCSFLILSYYSVVGGWVLSFEYKALTGVLSNATPDQIGGYLGELFGSPDALIFWHTIFMVMVIGIVVGGISKGIEKWAKILMPTLFVILMCLFVMSMFQEGFGKALEFLFVPDFSKLKWESILEAVGHSFFTLSLGMGAMITYGSYLSEKEDLTKTGIAVVVLDTAIALISGVVMFSVVFSFEGTEPSAGPGLMFATMPSLLSQMPGAYFLLVSFFILVAFAALTSAIALLEVPVSYIEERTQMSRRKVAIIVGAIIWAVGIPSALSFNVMKDSVNVFDLFDKATASVLMPLGGIFLSLFFGFKVKEEDISKALGFHGLALKGFIFACRFVAPIGVGVVLYMGISDWIG